ncbi:hypothetical protein MNBD_PLANCTO02-70 [hydrothermal vent metagenome]|uniref:Uncharacterized protein n=1 Tax=hydrothermal vent metagenome TaxID=652676 RepID=A0A3B1E052_9ZZZZ
MRKNGNSKKKRTQQRSSLSWRKLKVTCLLLGMTAMIASASLAFEDEKKVAQPKTPGLFGILVDEAPEDLSAEAFAILDGNWAKWSEGVSGLVADLYEDDSLGTQGQRDKIALLKIKIKTMETAIDDSAYSSLLDQLVMMHGRLSRRIDFAEAILDTLEQDPKTVRMQQLKRTAANLRKVASSTENKLNEYVNGSAWSPYLQIKALKETSWHTKKSMQAARNVLIKLAARNTLQDKSQKRFLNQPFFNRLQNAVSAYVAAVTSRNRLVNKKLLRQQLSGLVKATDRFSEQNLTADAIQIAKLTKALSKNTADNGSRIGGVVNKYYQNNNLQLVVGEDFLSRLMGESKTDRSNVDDTFMNARSIGVSDTTVSVSVDIKPNEGAALFDLVLSGTSSTNTISYASQAGARIAATGYHTFTATRGVLFDGDQMVLIGTGATMSVNPSVSINGAGTDYDGIPFIGSMARNQAYSTALSRRGVASQHAADKIRERVLPEYDRELQVQIPKLNKNLAGGLNKRLKKLSLYPQRKLYRSTSTQMIATSLISGKNELGGGAPNYGVASDSGLTICVHQSLLNNTLNRMNLAGKTLTDKQLKAKIKSFMSQLTGSDLSLSESVSEQKTPSRKKEQSQFIFAKQDPIRIQVYGGELVLTLRCGFKQKGEKDIPQHIISVPLIFEMSGDVMKVKRGVVKVSAVNPKDRSISVAGVIRKKIASSISNHQHNRNMPIHREGKSDVIIRIQKVKARNGWLSFEAI